MTGDPGAEIYRLFQAALELPVLQRQDFLKDQCGEDLDLLNRVKRMIEYADSSSEVGRNLLNPGSLAQRTRVFERGQLVSGRYQIDAFLNIGGMGEVYSALDLELDVLIALKTVRPEFASDEQAIARFKREVQLEREVVHENVCPLRVFPSSDVFR